jgi:hypothetical protein
MVFSTRQVEMTLRKDPTGMLTPSLKTKPDSDCVVETKVIGQYSQQQSD